MLETFLLIMQWVGGIFYLLNKVLFSVSERVDECQRRKWKIWSWITFLIGLPAWLIILSYRQNWIAASLEAVGGISMILGLYSSLKNRENVPNWLHYLAYGLIPVGLGLSVYQFVGITTFNQLLEIILAIGFLIGTYQLAKQVSTGYLWYIPMHIAAGWLLYRQEYYGLAILQYVSLGFILDAYWRRRKTDEKQT